MDVSTTTLICPNCKKPIPIEQTIATQFEEKNRKELEEERQEDRKKMLAWMEEQKKKISSGNDLELKALKEDNERKDQELKKSKEAELELLNKEKVLKEKLESVDLEVARRVNKEADRIREETAKKTQEENRLKVSEKDKQISDMLRQIEELKSKAQQGSQQLQGEVLELELEEMLKREFPVDEVREVGKGVKGADLIQIVKDSMGREAGKIAWETKRTKVFGGDWIEKLKGDMREVKADLAILVSSVLPPDVNNFTFKEGIYVTSFDTFLQVAHILRKSLIDLAQAKALSVGKNERKYEALYKYITSSEFAQYIGSMLDTFLKMKQTLDKEKGNMQRNWAEREKQIENLRNNTVTIHGSFSGLIEEPLPEIKSLEFEEIELVIAESREDDNG